MSARRTPLQAIVIDDDARRRTELVSVLQADADIKIVGQLGSLVDAADLIAEVRPDVIVLDLHLGDDGSRHIIEQVMAHTPTPILLLSARIEDRHSPSVVEALVAGALEALPTPPRWTPELGAELRRVVHQISRVHVIRHPRGNRPVLPRDKRDAGVEKVPIVAIAASTGGPSALATLLGGLTGLRAVVLVVQHLHPDFTGGLLEWMARVSALPVEMAAHGQAARPGQVYLAPAGAHLRIGAARALQLRESPVDDPPPLRRQLFTSVAEYGAAGNRRAAHRDGRRRRARAARDPPQRAGGPWPRTRRHPRCSACLGPPSGSARSATCYPSSSWPRRSSAPSRRCPHDGDSVAWT